MKLKGSYEVHHRRPLEYAHLFPEKDINAAANLKGLGDEVHQHINSIWAEFRSRRPNATPAEVDEVVAIIDERFGRWYDVPYSASDSMVVLGEAVKAARRRLGDYFPSR
ncbi:hypothetical protein [Archangium lansingense]|uniref:HNH endonuclease n=1 Tax=Archangium lansingense TaxID=2995310 RepID=A0ABT4AJE4_9BACT|nr:hypothetical protein [Archangium lansinium]MCY1081788.1 hypothetical protein [Archangium lansinium]